MSFFDLVDNKAFEAIQIHIRGLQEDNLPIPEPESFAEYIAVD